MWVLRLFLLAIVIGASTSLAFADRMPLEKPKYPTELGDTSNDIEVMDSETGQYVFRDSEATATFDPSKGRYDFRFKDEEGVWQKAYWIPNSNVDVVFEAGVSATEDGRFLYEYGANMQAESIRHLTQIMLEVLSDVGDPSGLGELEPPKQRQRWEAGEWVGKELSKDWGSRLWMWTRYTGNLTEARVRSSSHVTLYSKGLPTSGPCWLQGNGEGLFPEHWPAASISKLHSKGQGIMTDAAKGITVSPGLETVELPALMEYFNTSIEQGWLEEGAYRDELKALLQSVLSHHEAKETAEVLSVLSTIQKKVEIIYAEENSPMLSEAYALLYFNIEYLIENYEKDLMENEAVEIAPPGVTKD